MFSPAFLYAVFDLTLKSVENVDFFGLNFEIPGNFQSHEVVDRGSETQLQVSKNGICKLRSLRG